MFLGDFVEQLAAALQKQNTTMPYENEGPWHELFYELKKSDWPEGMAEQWSDRVGQLDADTKSFLDRTVGRAKEIFSSPAVSAL